jgi:hypothetical protein
MLSRLMVMIFFNNHEESSCGFKDAFTISKAARENKSAQLLSLTS